MAVEVVFPSVVLDAETGRLNRWLAAEGEQVREGQPLFEIEAGEAASEVEAPASGVLRGLRATAGERLPVGATLGWIVAEDEPFDPDLLALAGELRALLGSSAPAVEAPSVAPVEAASVQRTPADARVRATPLARRLARERGLDLGAIAGSGPDGRVHARDLEGDRRPSSAEAAPGRLNREWLQAGDSAPLVLLHGFGADLNGWRPLLRRLPASRPVLALDLPGHGGSPPADGASLAALVAATRAALAEEEIAAAHLVGHSLGGAVAAALAIDDAAPRALSLMLIAPAGLGPEINGPFLDGFLRARSEASLTPWMRLLVADPDALGAALVKTTLRQREDQSLLEAQRRLVETLFPDGVQAFSIREWIADLAMPAKIVWGAADRIIPARQSEGLSGTIGVHRFAGVGHMPHLEARRAVARLIEELAKAGD